MDGALICYLNYSFPLIFINGSRMTVNGGDDAAALNNTSTSRTTHD